MLEDLDDMLEDRVTLVKRDGTVFREEIPCIVTKGKIQIHDATLPIEVHDHLLRKLPNNLVEDYIVKDPVLHRGLGKSLYIVEVRKSDAPLAQREATVTNITNNLHGSNARVNMNSIDNSNNISGNIDLRKIESFIEQVRPIINLLPEPQREDALVPLTTLDQEIKSGNPSSSNIVSALHSLKSIAEGATGNVLASGIISTISSMFT